MKRLKPSGVAHFPSQSVIRPRLNTQDGWAIKRLASVGLPSDWGR
jgi:hypothetical protein